MSGRSSSTATLTAIIKLMAAVVAALYRFVFIPVKGSTSARAAEPRRTAPTADNPAEKSDVRPVSVVGMHHRAADVRKAFAPNIRRAIQDEFDDDELPEEGDYGEANIRVKLVLEDDNPHDADAVAVHYRGLHIGYLPAMLAPHFRALADQLGWDLTTRSFHAEAEFPLTGQGEYLVRVMLPPLKR